MSKEISALEGVNLQIESLRSNERLCSRNWSDFLERIGRPELISVWNENRPATYFSSEYMLPGLGANGGLGALSRDHFLQAVAVDQPSIFFGLSYAQRKAQTVGREGDVFFQNDPVEGLPVPESIGMEKLDGVEVRVTGAKGISEIPVYRYSIGSDATRLILLQVPGEVYPSEVSSDARLWNDAVIGFGGNQVIEALKAQGEIIEPAFYHLNESATVLGALAALDRMTTEYGGDEVALEMAIKELRSKTILTNHTLVPAAEASFSRKQCENFILSNISSPVVSEFVSQFIDQRGGKLVLLEMAMLLSGRYNGVSEFHAMKAVEAFQKQYGPSFYGQPIEFGAVTNGIFEQGWNAEMTSLLMTYDVLDEFGMPRRDSFNEAVDAVDPDLLFEMKGLAVSRLGKFLVDGGRTDQFGEVVQLPEDAIVIGDARRFADYKRRWMMFKQPDELEAILRRHPKAHIFISGKAHPHDTVAKPQLQFVLKSIASRDIFRERIHYLPDWDAELAKVLGPACSIWLNNPRVGEEACGTSGMKTGLGGALQVSTVDGFYAELDPNSFNAISGDTNSEAEFSSFYAQLDSAITTASNPKEMALAIKKLWKGGLLDIASGARMLADYAYLAFPEEDSAKS